MKIYYANGLCGAGKTYQMTRFAFDRAQNWQKKFILIQPTRQLISETVNDLNRLNSEAKDSNRPTVKVTAIHGDTVTEPVASIVSHLSEATDQPEILLVTQAAFLRLPYFHRADKWHLLCDEIPQVVESFCLNVPETHDLITQYFDTKDLDAIYDLAVPTNKSKLRQISSNYNGDEVWALFAKFAAHIASEHHDVYVLQSSYFKMQEGLAEQIHAFSILKPTVFDGFASVTIAGAVFKDSLLYRLWSSYGVVFEEHRPITKTLRYIQHQNGDKLTVRYITDLDWSKSLRDKPIKSDDGTVVKTVKEAVLETVMQHMNDEPFVWMGNLDVPDNALPGVRLPNTPHGINCYQGFHKAVIMSALNPSPAAFRFLDTQGVEGDEVKNALYRQAVYQAAMRTSLRNPNDETPKEVIVMDRKTAEWLIDLFPGSHLDVLSCNGVSNIVKQKPGPNKKHESDADRQREFRLRKKQKLMVQLAQVHQKSVMLTAGEHSKSALRIDLNIGDFVTQKTHDLPLQGSVISSIYSKAVHVLEGEDIETFISGLRDLHESVFEEKTDNVLFSPAVFNPELAEETSRGLANIEFVNGVWMDNDGGDLPHEFFAALFPRLRMVVYNSYSSTTEKPRYRVFIPTDMPMSVEVHKLIIAQIEKKLKHQGYYSEKQLKKMAEKGSLKDTHKCHGFDTGKFTSSSLFYLPCQAKNPADSFFIDYNSKKRKPIDVCNWLSRSIVHANPEPEPETVVVQETKPTFTPTGNAVLDELRRRLSEEDETARKEQAKARAIEAWRNVSAGAGNDGFFSLALSLAKAGYDRFDIQNILHQEAGYARHPEERRKEIKRVVQSVQKY